MHNNQTNLVVVVDNNVFIAAALAIKYRRLESANYLFFKKIIQQDGIESAMSDAMLYELADKLQEPRFAFSGAFIIDFVRLVGDASTIVPIRGLSYPCRDPKDSKFIETAVNSRAQFLVTYDQDLLDPQAARELHKRDCSVTTVRGFLFAVGLAPGELTSKQDADS
jgi:putative PIN family toxin of toxin-antitoxin system